MLTLPGGVVAMETMLALLMCVVPVWQAVAALTAPPRTPIEIATRMGTIRGFQENVMGRDVNVFLGIPFARPPVDELRFQRPVVAESWQGTLDATRLPNACPQLADTTLDSFQGFTMWNANTNISEDCLYLNVWAASDRRYDGARAVMVWIYGGAFTSGTSTLPLYDGRILAATGDVIVVSMQYRVGALGFLYLGLDEAPGNLGLLDQLMAIQWTFNNIDDYGGDNDRITLFGESAGAGSVSLHLMSPLTQKLVKRGILQSGSALATWATDTPARAQAKSLAMAKTLGCRQPGMTSQEVLLCLRKVPVANLTRVTFSVDSTPSEVLHVPTKPTVDGHFLRQLPADLVADGTFLKTNILIGSNRDEGMYFLFYEVANIFNKVNVGNLTYEQYLSALKGLLSSDDEALVRTVAFEYGTPYHYRTSPSHNYKDILDDVLGDSSFVCPVVDLSMHYAQNGAKVYMYRFLHRTTANNPWPVWTGAMHGYEIDHVFGLPLNVSQRYTPAESDLSRNIIRYWTNFAKTGDPNEGETGDEGSPLEAWPAYTVDSRRYLVLNTSTAAVGDGLRDRQCAFWRDLMPIIRHSQHNGGNPGNECSAAMTPHLPPALAVTLAAALAIRRFIPGL